MTDGRIDFDEFSSNYDELLQERTRFFSASDSYFAQYKVDVVGALAMPEPGAILEFGCGTGRNLPFLRRRFPSAVLHGTDISEESIEVARATMGGAASLFVDGREDPGRTYDLILVAGVYHHVEPSLRAGVTARLRALLSDAGHLVVFEHNPWNPVTRRIVSDCPYDADAELLTLPSLRRLLAAAGLREAGSGYCLFLPPALGRAVRLERLLRWLPLGGQYFLHARR